MKDNKKKKIIIGVVVGAALALCTLVTLLGVLVYLFLYGGPATVSKDIAGYEKIFNENGLHTAYITFPEPRRPIITITTAIPGILPLSRPSSSVPTRRRLIRRSWNVFRISRKHTVTKQLSFAVMRALSITTRPTLQWRIKAIHMSMHCSAEQMRSHIS